MEWGERVSLLRDGFLKSAQAAAAIDGLENPQEMSGKLAAKLNLNRKFIRDTRFRNRESNQTFGPPSDLRNIRAYRKRRELLYEDILGIVHEVLVELKSYSDVSHQFNVKASLIA